jgi:choline dehydrogenase-like flavoprotein
LIASRLAGESHPKCSVLLVEAGGDDSEDADNLVPGLTKPKFGSLAGNWSYSTTPQSALGGRTIPYPRGRGLGGCSANNFMAWIRGPKCDWDEWAERVGDPWWKWENAVEVMKRFEDFRERCPEGAAERYATPKQGLHGKGGPIAVGYGEVWQPLVMHCLEGAEQAGHKVNRDVNSGEPEGLSVAQFNVDNGMRRTSAGAFLSEEARKRLDNLTLVTKALCSRILFDADKRAIGAELIPTEDDSLAPVSVRANHEVILCAGAFASPQILLLSGIGPAKDLAARGIPCIEDIPAVGKNVQDHTALACEFIIDPSIPGHNQLLNDAEALEAAQKEYQKTKTGPLATFGASAAVLFPRLKTLHSIAEFHALPESTKSFLLNPNRPSTELWMHGGPLFYTSPCPPDASVLCLEGLCQSNLSRGTLHLKNGDPRELPEIDPGYSSHPYDLQIALATMQEIIRIAKTPAIEAITKKVLYGPRSPGDHERLASIDDVGELEAFIKENMTQGFHSMSTCIMGTEGEENKVVGSDFKVVRMRSLRVADMSTCPILTTNHTQVKIITNDLVKSASR